MGKNLYDTIFGNHWIPVNLTPHPICYMAERVDGTFELQAEIAPSGVVARVSIIETPVDPEQDDRPFALVINETGNVEGLPEPDPEDGDRNIYIVSRIVFDAIQGREDVMCPDTGKTAVRDANGRILGVTQFVVKVKRNTSSCSDEVKDYYEGRR